MVQRINFAEKGKYTLTYRNMIVVVCGWFVFCLLIYSIQSAYAYYVNHQLASQEEQYKILNQEKDKRLAILEMASKQVEEHVNLKGIAEYIAHLPLWSEALEEMEGALPANLWLKKITSEDLGEGNFVKLVKMSGVSLNHNAIVKFVKRLNASKMFKNAMVVELGRGLKGDINDVPELKTVAEGHKEKNDDSGDATLPVQETSFVVRAEVYFPETKWK